MEDKTLNQDLETAENVQVENNTPEENPKKKKGLKGFLQLLAFIGLSLLGFAVQMIIEQVCARVPALKNPINDLQINGSTEFDLFGIKTVWGPFFVTLVAVFLCKIINFVLHRKVLFKPRHNLAFGIIMYILFSIVLWFGSALVKAPVRDALMDWNWWTDHITSDPEGWAVTVAVMVYSTADLIIMFFAEKFLIMNDKLFQKKGKEEAVAVEDATIGEQAVASDVAQEAQAPVEEVKAEDIVEESAQESPVETAEEKAEEQVIQAPVEEVEEIVEAPVDAQVEPPVEEDAQEAVAEVIEAVQENETAAEEEEEKTAEEKFFEAIGLDAEVEKKKAAAKKTAAKKTTATTAKKLATTKSASASKTTAAKKATATKSTASKSTAAKKATTTKASVTKSTATKSTTAKKPATTKAATTAKKTTTTAKKPTTTAKATTSKSTATKSTTAKKPATTKSTTAKKTTTTTKSTTAKKTTKK